MWVVLKFNQFLDTNLINSTVGFKCYSYFWTLRLVEYISLLQIFLFLLFSSFFFTEGSKAEMLVCLGFVFIYFLLQNGCPKMQF